MANEKVEFRPGGSFAPAITPEALAKYRSLAEKAPAEVGAAVKSLADLVELFGKTPASKRKGTPHPSGSGKIVPLEEAEVKRIFDAVPWPYELDAISALFETIPAGNAPLRNAAFHLLWYARELSLDREPITKESL